MNVKTISGKIYIFPGLAMAMMGGEAFAQVPDGAAGDSRSVLRGIEEVVVTARRREERLQDVPVSISAIDSGMMQARGINSTEDLMGSMPNFSQERLTTRQLYVCVLRGDFF